MLHLPQGYHVEYGGAYAEQQQSFKELLIILDHCQFAGIWCDPFPIQAISGSHY